ncbi:MAG: LysR family transcriptional regulator [Candidatus Onthomonas sp.]
MEINYFKEFVTLSETGNFTEAAEQLFISQATLSKHIKSMEKELNELLFLRTTRKLELTEYGRLFLEDARKIAAAQQHYMDQLFSYQHSSLETLRIGSIPMMPHYGITKMLSSFSRAYPSCNLELTNGGELDLMSDFSNGKFELAFMRYCSLPEDEIAEIPLLDDYICVVLAKDHPLASEKSLLLKQIQGEQLIMLQGHATITDFCDKLFADANFTPNIRLHMTTYINILDLVRNNIGITLMTYRTAHYIAQPDLSIIPVAPRAPIHLSLFYSKKHPLSPIAKTFIAFIKSNTSIMQFIE